MKDALLFCGLVITIVWVFLLANDVYTAEKRITTTEAHLNQLYVVVKNLLYETDVLTSNMAELSK